MKSVCVRCVGFTVWLWLVGWLALGPSIQEVKMRWRKIVRILRCYIRRASYWNVGMKKRAKKGIDGQH